MTVELKIGNHNVRVTHEDRVVFPEAGLTKLDLARHYERVAPLMLPYVRDRPLALQAYPDGIEGDGYFMKAVPRYFPDWVKRATVPKKGGTITHVLAQNAATLVYLSGQNVVTVHTWLSRADKPHQPDRVTLDFDPSGDELRRGPGRGALRRRPAARSRPRPVRDDHRIARHPRRLPVAARAGLLRGPRVRPHARRGDGRRRPASPDARVAQGRARRSHLRRREPDRVRPARGRAVRGQAAPDRRRWRCRSTGRSCPTERSAPTAGRSQSIGERLEAGDPWDGMSRRARKLPRID